MATVMDVANGLVTELTSYNPQIVFAPEFDLRKSELEKLVILPIGKEMEIETRVSNQNVFVIDIAYVKKVTPSTNISTLVSYVETIGNSLLRGIVADTVCVKLTWNPLFSVDELKSSNVFISVMEARFKEMS